MIHKLVLADDHSVFRTGVARVLAVEDDCRIVSQCNDIHTLMKTVSGSLNAIVVFAASLNPDVSDLVRTTQEQGGRMIAILENNENAQPYVREKINGIVYRDVSNVELLRCVRSVGRGETYVHRRPSNMPNECESDLVAERVRERLTPKELKIIGLLLQGYKNKDIAEELNNSEQVIKNYLRAIFDKTGVSDRLELALFTMHHKLLAEAAAKATDYGSKGSYMLAKAVREPIAGSQLVSV